MAIDPDTLRKQQLRLVAKGETRCSRCGRRTRDATGTCSDCRATVPDLRRFTVERINGLLDACRAELKRRRDEINAALNEEG